MEAASLPDLLTATNGTVSGLVAGGFAVRLGTGENAVTGPSRGEQGAGMGGHIQGGGGCEAGLDDAADCSDPLGALVHISHHRRSSLTSPNPPPRSTQSTRQRMLLRSAAVQLLDEAGNSVPTAGVPVRFALRWGADGRGGDAGEPPEGAALPSLTSSLGALGACETETDAAGRAALGDLSIEEGSGVGAWGARCVKCL